MHTHGATALILVFHYESIPAPHILDPDTFKKAPPITAWCFGVTSRYKPKHILRYKHTKKRIEAEAKEHLRQQGLCNIWGNGITERVEDI